VGDAIYRIVSLVHRQAVDLDALAMQHQMAGHPAEPIEMAQPPERRARLAQVMRLHDRLELQGELQPAFVDEGQLVFGQRLKRLDGNAGRQGDIGQVLALGQAQGREVGAIRDLPR
jgi:hypothetical protein